MKPRIPKDKGSTLLEIMVAMGIVSLAGGMIFMVLDVGVLLYTKNTSINISHDQARIGYMQLVRDIHVSASPVVCSGITGASGTVGYSSTGQAVSFQVLRAGPYIVMNNVATGGTSIQIAVPTGSYIPVAGQRLIVPAYGVQADIASVSTTGTVVTVNLLNTGTDSVVALTSAGASGIPLTQALTTSTTSGIVTYNYNISCYITDRTTYLVSGSASGSTLATWFGEIYPSVIGTNRSYSNLIGSGTNTMYMVYHNTTSGTLTAVQIARGLINPTNLTQPLAPFIVNATSSSSNLSSTSLTFSDITTADLQHASAVVTGTNMTVNGTTVTGTALVFSRESNSLAMNMCITGGTLAIRNQITAGP